MFDEFKKIFLSPLPLLLLAGSLIMNGWMIWNYSGSRDLIRACVDIVREAGAASGEGEMSVNKTGMLHVTGNNATELYERLKDYDASEDVHQGIPSIKNMLQGAVALCESMTYKDMADAFIREMHLENGAAEYAADQYAMLQEMLNKNRENQVDSAFFVPGHRDFFSVYARWLPLFLTVQSIVAAVIMIIRSVDDPFSDHMESVIYTSLCGRYIHRKKLAAGLLGGIVFAMALWGITFAAANAVLPLGPLWRTPVGSMMVLDNFSPIVGWFPMNLMQYIVCQFLVCVAVVLLFVLAAFGLELHLKNGFYTFMGLGFICACMYALSSLIPRLSILYFILQCNPVDLARKAGHWFVCGSTFLAPKGYELFSVVLWLMILILWAIRQMKIFKKADI